MREELQISSTDSIALSRIKRDINIAYQEVCSKHNWRWLKGYRDLVLPAYVNAGTVSVTQGSNQVTLSQSVASSKTGFKFSVDGFAEVYTISHHGAGTNTFSLNTDFNGPTSATCSYHIWTDRIPLPTDAREVSEAWCDVYRQNLDTIGLQEYRRLVSLSPKAEGRPTHYYVGDFIDPTQLQTILGLPSLSTRKSDGVIKTLVFNGSLPSAVITSINNGDPVKWNVSNAGQSTYNGDILVSAISTTNVSNDTITYTGLSAYQEPATADTTMAFKSITQEQSYNRYRELFLYPCLINSNTAIHVDYIKDVLPLNNDSDEPLMPVEDRIVLLYAALARAWTRARNPEEALRNNQFAEQKLKQMAAKLQGDFDKPKLLPSKMYLGSKRNQMRRRQVDMSDPFPFATGGGGSPTGPAQSVAVFDNNGNLSGSVAINQTLLNYLSGLTGNVQTQLNSALSTLTLPQANIFVGNSSSMSTAVPVSGDASLASTGAVSVTTVGGSTASDIHAAEQLANAATDANTASAIVKRDSSGNFSAGTITANLTGNASGTALNVTGTVAIANGGTGQTTQQAALNAISGTQSAGKYLRSDGTNTSLATIQAADVPTLNQDTTGSAASFTGSLVGDVIGTQGATVVSAVGGYTATAIATGALAANTATSAATSNKIVIRDSNSNAQLNNLIENGQSVATSGATTTLSVSSPYFTQFTGTTNHTLKLPAANTLTQYQQFFIANRSTGTVTVTDNAGTTLIAMSTNTQSAFTATNIGSAAGSWDTSYSGGSGGTTSPLSTKGDLYTFSTTNTRLPVGTDGQVVVADSSQTTGLRWTTAQQGNKNYITYNNFENNATTGWSLAHTTLSSGVPNQTSGSWTSATSINLGVTSSGQLAGTYSLSLTSPGATVAGDMLVSQVYNIDIEDQAKVLTNKFYYSTISGSSNLNFSGTSSGTFQIWIFDVTNSAWIQPAGCYGMTQGTGVGYATSTWQTPSNMTQFRLALVCVNASSGASTLYLDDFSVGPQTAPLGSVSTDWVPYTPTFTGFGTVSNVGFYSRRYGDTLQVHGFFTAGTPSASTAQISLGYNGASGNVSIDNTKINTSPGLVGNAILNFGSASQVVLLAVGAVNYVEFGVQATSNAGTTAVGGTSLMNTGSSMTLYFEVPIAGWGSNVQISSDTDTRVISTRVTSSSTVIPTGTATQVVFSSVASDSSGSYSTGTGSYTCPVSGYYDVTANAYYTTGSSGTNVMYVYKNGTDYAQMSQGLVSAYAGGGAVNGILCNAGDTLAIYVIQNQGSSLTLSNNSSLTWASFSRKSGPAVVAASESVNGRYFSSSSSITSSFTTTTFATKDFDSHAAYSSGTLTIPVSGRYQINAGLQASGTFTANNAFKLAIFVNGVEKTEAWQLSGGSTGATNLGANVSDIINCLAGDAVTIRASSNASSVSINASNFSNYFSWSRVGN